MERYYDILIKISLVISVLALIGTMPYWISKIGGQKDIFYKRKYDRYYDEHKTLDIEQLYYKRATLKYDIFFSTGIPALVALFIFIMTIMIAYSISIVLIVLFSIAFISIAIVTKLYSDSTLELAIVENCLEMKKENVEH